jgi:signal transduction histidine kinase
VTAALLWFFRASLPVALDVTGPEVEAAQHPLLAGHPLLLVAHVLAALCFGVAAVVFTVQGARSRDELLSWLGPAFVLGAFARVNYVLFPSLYTDWLYTGDLLRTASHVLLLVGATREIQQFWRAQSDVAVLEDRRRLARELHDGVIQELAYIKTATYAVASAADDRHSILAACDRALDEARAAVHALGSDDREPLGDTLQRAVRQLAERYEVQVDLDVATPVPVTSDQRHALVRIAREAVTNAVRHGHARRISVRLTTSQDARCLAIRDDGSGFEVETVADPGKGASGTGYGLISMRDRARGLPGSLTVRSTPGMGSEVAVRW